MRETLLRHEAVQLADGYERLRADTAARQSVGQRLFCQQGLAAWLAQWCCVLGPSRVELPPTRGSTDPMPLPEADTEALTHLLASLVHPMVTGEGAC